MTWRKQRQFVGIEPAQQTVELAILSRMLCASRGKFSITVAIHDDRRLRDTLIDELRQTHESLEVISIPRNTHDILGACRNRRFASPPTALCIVDLEKSFQALSSLEASREQWMYQFDCPIIFWLPEYAAAALSMYARDFWAWRSHEFNFEAGVTEWHAGSEAKEKRRERNSAIIAYVLIAFLLIVFFSGPHELPQWKLQLLRFLASVAALVIGYIVAEPITLISEGKLPGIGKIVVRAMGGVVLFILVFFGWSSSRLAEDTRSLPSVNHTTVIGASEPNKEDEPPSIP